MAESRGIPINQAFMIMMLTAGLTNHVMIIPVLVEKSGRDSWITILLSALVFLPIIVLTYGVIHKMGNRTITEALEQSRGKWARLLIVGMSSLYFFTFAFYTLKEVIEWTKSNYMIQTPVIATTLLLIVLCYITVNHGMKTIAVSAGILLPIVVILGIFVSLANERNKNYSFCCLFLRMDFNLF